MGCMWEGKEESKMIQIFGFKNWIVPITETGNPGREIG